MWFCSGVVVTWLWWRRKWIHKQSEGQGYEIGIGCRIEWVSLKNLNDITVKLTENPSLKRISSFSIYEAKSRNRKQLSFFPYLHSLFHSMFWVVSWIICGRLKRRRLFSSTNFLQVLIGFYTMANKSRCIDIRFIYHIFAFSRIFLFLWVE